MEEQCFKQLTEAIANWPTTDVRVAPGVMYQIKCGQNENLNIEYQINWFVDCSETYVHNHRHSFDTLCLEGGYTEKLWKIIDDNTGAITYQFDRKSGNIFDIPQKIRGALCHIETRHHYPGNQMYVNVTQFHSVSPTAGFDGQVVTFLSKQKHSMTSSMLVLSSSPTIDARTDELRPATEDERQITYNKLQKILLTRLQQKN